MEQNEGFSHSTTFTVSLKLLPF